MPPELRGSIATWRSERMSLPQCPTSAEFLSAAMDEKPHHEGHEGRTKDTSCYGICPATLRDLRGSSELGQNGIGHLHGRGRALADRFRASGDAHHVVAADFALLHYRRHCVSDP